jgi:hypothetical protein
MRKNTFVKIKSEIFRYFIFPTEVGTTAKNRNSQTGDAVNPYHEKNYSLLKKENRGESKIGG